MAKTKSPGRWRFRAGGQAAHEELHSLLQKRAWSSGIFMTVTCLGSGASPAWLASVPSLPKSNSRWKAQHLGRSVSAGKPCGGHTALPPVTAVKASLGFQRETCLPLSSHCSPPESRQVFSRMSPQQQLQGRGLGGFCYNPHKKLREDQTDILPR